MAATAKGKELEATASELNERTAQVVRTADADTRTSASGGAGAKQFGRRFDAGNKTWEQRTAIKQAIKTDPQGNTPFGQLQFSDKDAEALLKYEQAAREAAFDSYFAQNFHVNDLATRRLAQDLYPEWYEQRERAMIDRAKAAIIIKNIMLRGPKDEKELQIVYGLQSGDIKLGKDWDRIGGDAPLFGTNDAKLTTALGGKSLLFVPFGRDVENMRVPYAEAPFAAGNLAAGGTPFRAPWEANRGDPRQLPGFLNNML
jgi:hypothetical protein